MWFWTVGDAFNIKDRNLISLNPQIRKPKRFPLTSLEPVGPEE